MAAQGPIVFWVANHRLHHAFADTDRDPHSPQPQGSGWWGRAKGLVARPRWLAVRCQEDRLEPAHPRLARGSPGDEDQRLVLHVGAAGHRDPRCHRWAGHTIGARPRRRDPLGRLRADLRARPCDVGGELVGPHDRCTAQFPLRDESRNIGVLAPPTMGGSWHNNHHARPALAQTRRHWWQLDLAGDFIRLLDRLGLVHNVRYVNSQSDHAEGAHESRNTTVPQLVFRPSEGESLARAILQLNPTERTGQTGGRAGHHRDTGDRVRASRST